MAASFPGAIKNFSAVVNGVTKLVAALFNSPYDEITAIETALGTNLSNVRLSPYIKVSDHKAQNTAGGTFTSGAWQTRTINTENNDTDALCSIASNQITLAAGTYECFIKCPAYGVNLHMAQLYNVTDATTLLVGTAEKANSAGYTHVTSSIIMGRFTIAAQKVLEIRHQCQTTGNTNGFGVAANFGTEVYTIAEFRKVA